MHAIGSSDPFSPRYNILTAFVSSTQNPVFALTHPEAVYPAHHDEIRDHTS